LAASTKRYLSMASCSSCRCADGAARWPSSTLGISLSIYPKSRVQGPDEARHFGLVVDDKEKVRRRLKEAGVKTLPGRGVEFRDPWGNRVQIVEYANIQFTKHQAVLEGMGCVDLHKSREAIEELARKGMTVKEN
jgi:lactoylglutathione lyase